jgi:2-keto-4-pentenoate hydratase/2-oxohepta-3-ene-1,7-dioic acid hydratase in catechol pathway
VKLVTFHPRPVFDDRPRTPRLGLLAGEQVADLNACTRLRLAGELNKRQARAIADYLAPPDMLTFLQRGDEAMSAARQTLAYVSTADDSIAKAGAFSLSEVQLLAPLLRPNSIRDFIAFEEHIKTSYAKLGLPEVPRVWYELPVYYKGNPGSVIGSDQDVIWPSYTEKLDYELELGMVIGRQGKNIPKEDAAAYIAGYTIFNDMSARDIQGKEMSLQLGPAKSKDFDTGNVIGPCLVTPDEFDPGHARMVARVNGEVWSEGNAGDMHYTFADLIAHVSMSETLYPGDLFGSGTVGGGCGVELDRWLQPGDTVELEVEGLGVLRNRIVRPLV